MAAISFPWDAAICFFLAPRTCGLQPKVVVTDGSNLHPAVLAELWPDADRQLCVFILQIVSINSASSIAIGVSRGK